ncbi:hypothetical protein T484DRAFT_2517051 [Baffinella frigidus]|nr:hypothetical protein T484DRAFT_2517051 [Cryptophyta sp. CCMP2293]
MFRDKFVNIVRKNLEQSVSALSFWGLFLVFVVYPSVSVEAFNTFSCIDLGRSGNWLKSDMRVACPESGGFVYVCSIFAIFIYPVGIPLGMVGMLLYFKVPKMASQKHKAAGLKALVAAFSQEAAAGKEEGITGRELERWWEGPEGWKRDPVETIGGEVQLKALLRHEWHDPGAGESDAPDHTTRLLERISVEQEDNRKWLRAKGRTTSTRVGAEAPTVGASPHVTPTLSVPNNAVPGSVPGTESRPASAGSSPEIQEQSQAAQDAEAEEDDGLDNMTLQMLRRKGTLCWNGEFGEEEERAMHRAGFLFEIYEVEYWWFELFEMARKLCMTSVLVFVSVGSLGQILVGLIVIFASFVVTFSSLPYVNRNLDRCQLFALASQFIVLQYGLVLHLDVSNETSQSEKAIVNAVMLMLNGAIFFLPPLSILLQWAPTGVEKACFGWPGGGRREPFFPEGRVGLGAAT